MSDLVRSMLSMPRCTLPGVQLGSVQILGLKIETSYDTCFSVRFSDYAASNSSISDFQNSPLAFWLSSPNCFSTRYTALDAWKQMPDSHLSFLEHAHHLESFDGGIRCFH